MHGFLKKPMHIGTVGSRNVPQHLKQFLITFRRRTASPLPNAKPNTNENRNGSKRFGTRRSPPPAANGNRSSSTASALLRNVPLCGELTYVWKWEQAASLCELREESSAYTIYGCRCPSTWCIRNCIINVWNTKRRLLYLKTQFVPRSKHFSSRL